MNKERELLKEVAYELDAYLDGGYFPNAHVLLEKVENLLDRAEQEPVAWMNQSGSCFLSDGNKYSELWSPLYAAPPSTREPLSDEEIRTIVNQLPSEVDLATGIEFCRIIDKHWS